MLVFSTPLLVHDLVPPTQRPCLCHRCTTRPTRADHGRSSSPPSRVHHPAPPQVRPATLQLQPGSTYPCAALAGRRAYNVTTWA
eukprot:scaffold121383_cov18-Phaeocystis_antarctica.AAC.1